MTAIENNQIKELSERMDSVTDHLTDLGTSVKEIRDAILGTEYNQNQAYKARIETLEAFRLKVEVKIIKAQIWGTMAGSALVVILELLYKYAQIFIKK